MVVFINGIKSHQISNVTHSRVVDHTDVKEAVARCVMTPQVEIFIHFSRYQAHRAPATTI